MASRNSARPAASYHNVDMWGELFPYHIRASVPELCTIGKLATHIKHFFLFDVEQPCYLSTHRNVLVLERFPTDLNRQHSDRLPGLVANTEGGRCPSPEGTPDYHQKCQSHNGELAHTILLKVQHAYARIAYPDDGFSNTPNSDSCVSPFGGS